MALLKNSAPFRIIILVILLSIAMFWYFVPQGSKPPSALSGVLRPEPKLLQSFELVDQNGVLLEEQVFKDKWSFVFFGYTSCPDICPTTLNVLSAVTDILAKEHRELSEDSQVIFISVDPERDTVDKLAEYMKFFNKDFVGATGKKNNIDAITQQFGAAYMMDKETAPGQYLVGHTSAIFLVDNNAGLVASFSQPHVPETIISLYQGIRTYLSK